MFKKYLLSKRNNKWVSTIRLSIMQCDIAIKCKINISVKKSKLLKTVLF